MAGVITTLNRVEYTWDTAEFDWDSSIAETSTWDNAGLDTVSLDISNEITFSETPSLRPGIAKGDSIVTQDWVTHGYLLCPNEAIAWLEIYIDNFNATLTIDYHLSVSDICGKELPIQQFQELASLSESYLKCPQKGHTDTVTIAETISRVVAASLSELIDANDNLSNLFSHGFDEVAAVADSFTRQFSLQPSEAISLTDFFIDLTSFFLTIGESITINEKGSKVVNLGTFAELLSVLDGNKAKMHFQVNDVEGVNMTEVFGRTVAFARMIEDEVTFADALTKSVNISRQDAAMVADQFVRNLEGVIEELRLAGDVDSLEALLEMMEDSPANYGKFETYLPGQYTFKKALLNTQLKASGTDSLPSINYLRVTSDLPDREERGEVTVPAGGEINVTYLQEYYYKPEVSLTLVSGTELGVPRVYNASTTGFTIRIYNGATQLIGGLVSWKATGA